MQHHSFLRKAAVSVVGVVILAAGVVMLVLPGPGLLVVLLGLVVLGSEYDWAARRIDTVKDKALDTADNAARSPFQLAVGALGALSLIAVGLALGLVDSLPFSGWATGGSIIFSGLIAAGTLVYSVWRVRSGAADRTPAQSAG